MAGMNIQRPFPGTLSDLPLEELRSGYVEAVRTVGPESGTARAYWRAIRQRLQREAAPRASAPAPVAEGGAK